MSAKFDASAGGTLLFRVPGRMLNRDGTAAARRGLKKPARRRVAAQPAAASNRDPPKPQPPTRPTNRRLRPATHWRTVRALDRFVRTYFECLF